MLTARRSVAESSVDVTVIVAVYNGAATIRQCIESVLSQTGCAVEIIIVDALSDDGTQEVVESYGAAIGRYIREADHGIYDAWNKALVVARGRWCAFLGSDDFYISSDSVAALLAVARCGRKEDRRPAFVYGGVEMLGSFERVVLHPDPPDAIRYLRRGRMLPHPGSLHQSETLIDAGGFDSTYRVVSDLQAVLRLARAGGVARCDAVTTVMRMGGVSTAAETRSLARREWYRFLRSERGWVVATSLWGLRMFEYGAGRITESIVVRFLGTRRGERAFMRIRRLFRRPPRMSPLNGAARGHSDRNDGRFT